MLTIIICIIYVCATLFLKKDKVHWDDLSTGAIIGMAIAYFVVTYLGR